MRNELVSVIVLTYRKFEYLEKNLKSIFIQNYNNIEIIIQDDYSDNFNEDKIKNLFKSKPNNITNVIINRNTSNLGTVRSFNNAIKLSKGNIIIPLSVDDEFYDENCITKIVDFFKETECRICTAKRQVIDESGIEIKILPEKNDIIYLCDDNINNLLNRICKSNFISGAVTYYRRELFDLFGYFDEEYKLLEDYPYYLSLLLKNEKILFCDYITIRYRLGGISTNKVVNPILKSDFEKVYRNIIFHNKKQIDITTYREAKLKYYRDFCKDKRFNYILGHFLYLDRVIVKIFKKYIRTKGDLDV